ncbi:vitamin B12-dependent ribonucleotide reductase [bacterium]|nr:vitamin B12-dependent ribonucleotide reductase [bacterium]
MPTATLSQKQKITREPISLTENAIRVLQARYLKKDKKGKVIETPEELFSRVAKIVADAEKTGLNIDNNQADELEIKFYNLMVSGKFMPNSPTLMNAGRSMGMLSACFVLPIEDSIDGIFTSIKNTALIQKAGGGTGFDFSSLRPNGDIVTSSGGTTSGPLSFLKVFSEATEAIQQGAFRRGANMGILNITHPDIIEFITIKDDLTKLTNFNLSISIPDSFMKKLNEAPDSNHIVINPRTGESSPLERKDEKDKFWSVKDVFNLILDCAWASGEPGLIFIDRINRDNPTPHLGRISATNPCGEQPLLPYEACNLGSINLSKFVREKNNKPYLDFKSLKETVHIATRFLDNVIDANKYPLPQIAEICKGNRKIGLGVMGFADALFQMGIPYSSDEAVEMGEKIMQFINDESHNASEELAKLKGVFPNWKGSKWDKDHKRSMRNAATTTVAPTGTISIIANCSSGIEPLFSLAFFRNVLNGEKLIEVNQTFSETAKRYNFYSDTLINSLASGESLLKFNSVPEKIKQIFVTAHDITPEWHIKMQAGFQHHCDSSISKTINFPHNATKEQVENIYRLAFEYEVKGVTVYRDGCRMNQPMAHDKKEKKAQAPKPAECVKPISIPEIMSCLRIRQKTPFGNMHVKIAVEPDTGKEREVFAQLGKGGDIANSDLEAICRMLSLFLRCNGSLKLALRQLDGIGSSLSVPSKDGRVISLADGLAKAIKKYMAAKKMFGLQSLLLGKADLSMLKNTNNGNKKSTGRNGAFKIKCPECNEQLYFEEGCAKCYSCGFSKC